MTEQTPIVRWSRLGAMALAWLIAAGVVVQIFLAGLALFDSSLRWQDHIDFGYMIGAPLLLLLVLVLTGRMPRPIIGMTVVLVVVYIVQITLPTLSAGYIAAVHPLVGFVLLGLPVQIGTRVRSLTSTASQPVDPRIQEAP